MKLRRILFAKELWIYLIIAFIALFFGIGSVFADDLSQINQDSSSEVRKFTLSPTDVFNVSENTGVTAPATMSVIGSYDADTSDISIINYGDNCSGFVVENNVNLVLDTVKFTNAFSTESGAFLNNSGTVTINSVVFKGNRVINNSANVSGGTIYNTGTISTLNADFNANGVSTSSYGRTAMGGAIYNDGTIDVISGNFLDNYAVSDRGKAYGGAIYTTSSLMLLANDEDYKISGNSVTSNGIKDKQAIYVANENATLTISAMNGGSWIIDDSIDGVNGYNVALTGDTNSYIKLNESILHAQVNVNNINLYISERTFDNSNVYVTGSSVVSMLDDRAVTYTFNMLDTSLGDANFEFDIDAVGVNSDCISVGSSSIGAIKVSNLNFLNGVVKSGSYKLLTANNDNVYLELTKDHYSYTNITPVLKWNAEVDAYDYDLSLEKSNGITFDTVVVEMLNEGIRQDNLSALNKYKTTFDRQLVFDSESDIFVVSADTGLSANMSSLSILGQTVGDKYSTIDYNNTYSGFIMSSGSELNVNNITFQNAVSSQNGAVINIEKSNVSVDFSNGKMVSNTSEGNGGAIYLSGNSFFRLDNVRFENNNSLSGGAIYNYSDGIYSPSITGITGSFNNNSAKEFGGAIANYTSYSNGYNYSRISTIIANFENNSVSSSKDGYGGAIYNTGNIDSIVGDFVGNYVVSEENSYGGAIANLYIYKDSGIYKGAVSNIESSFRGNYLISDNGVALGGAIYTANDLTFNINDIVTIKDNYTIDVNGKASNAIFVDTTYYSAALNFNLSPNSVLEISDIIDGGYFDKTSNTVKRGIFSDINGDIVSTKYKLSIQGDNSSKVIFNDVYRYDVSGEDYIKTDEIVSGIMNANVTVSDIELVMGIKTFSDENTSLVINSGLVNMQDSEGKDYYINNLVSTTLVDYKLDFNISVNDDGEVVVNTDRIFVGENSSGTIRITDIGLNSLEDFYNAVEFIANNSPDEYIDVKILDRANSSDSIKIDVDFSITDNPKDVTIAKDYYNAADNAYVVTNNSFIGIKGFMLNESADSFRIGVLNREDTLSAINSFETESGTPVARVFNMENATDVYVAKEDLGETTAGTLTINGNNAVIDLDGYSGFILNRENTKIALNDISIQGASVALETNILSETSGVVVENSIFKDNDVAISNNEGNITLKNSEILGSDKNQFNKINNSSNGYITSENSKLYSSIVNNGNLIFKGTNVVGKEGTNINISGNGSISTSNDAIFTDLRYALITDAVDGNYNTFTLNSGKLFIGTITFANSKFIANSGIIDLSGSEDGTLAHIDQPYNIGTYICDYANGADAGFIIDIDFLNKAADQIVIADESSYGTINVAQINGIESISSFTNEGFINILSSASTNVDLKINLEKSVYRFYIDSYLEEDRDEYVLYDNSFVGEIKLTTTPTGIEISRNPIYDALVELNQLGKYQDETDKTKTRTFILRTSDVIYSLPEKIGVTYPGVVNVLGAYDIVDGDIKISTIDFRNSDTNIATRGFEVIGDGKVILNIDKVHFVNARTENDVGDNVNKNGSVLYIDNTNPNTKITLTDTVMEFNYSEGLGGAIYSNNDLTIIAENINTVLSGNKQLCSDINPNGTSNDIYLGANGIQTLNLIAHNNNRIGIESGLEISENTKLILNINDNSENSGTVHLTLHDNLGSGINPIAGLVLNGGIFDLRDGNCTSIYTSDLTVNSDTDFIFDIDLMAEKSDQIYTTGLRNNKGSGRVVLKPENFNFLSGQIAVDSIKFRLLNVYCATSKFMTFYDEFNPEGTNAVLLYSVFDETEGTDVNIYAKLGLNGSIIIGSSPDCGDDLLVKSIMSPKNQTYKLTEDNVLFNYGTLRMQGDVQSKKLTIKGDGYSSISTPSELFGITLRGTETIPASKQQLVGSKFTFKGFNGAVINQGGKVTLSSVHFLSNETDDNGSAVRNLAGSVILNGAKKSYANLFNNFATNNGGAIYNSGSLTLKYTQFGKSPSEEATYENYAYIGGAVYNDYKATISSSNFEQNIGELCAGAIYSSAYMKLTSNNFIQNSSINGGAVYISALPEKANAVSISKNNFYSNEAENKGGAVYIDKGTVSISSSNFGSAVQDNNGNTAQYGGAIFNTRADDDTVSLTKVSSSKFAWNKAETGNGGAIYNEGNLALSKNSFGLSDKAKNKYGNFAENGGAIYNTGLLTDSSSSFVYNVATNNGGAVYNAGHILTYDKKGNISGGFNSSKFTENTAESGYGGAVYNNGEIGFSKAVFTSNSASDGGAVYNAESGTATIISSTFRQNTVTENGGAIYNDGVMYLNKSKIGDTKKKMTYANTAQKGSAIYNNSKLTINGSTIAYNQTAGDAGMGAVYNSVNGHIDMISTSVTGNTSTLGGGVYNLGNLTTDNKTKFTSNTAENGGAIYNSSDKLFLYGSAFSKNTAVLGGALYNTESAVAVINHYDYVTNPKGKEKHKYYNPSFSSNVSANGGAIYNAGTLTVANTTFSKNNANTNSSELTTEGKENSGKGGAIYNNGKLTVSDSSFSSNIAVTQITDVTSNDDGVKTTYSTTTSYGGKGGAIYNNSDENITITKSTLTSNKAGENGGAISNENENSELNITGSNFKSNSSLNKIVTKEYSVNNTSNKKSSTKTTSNVYDESGKGGAVYTQGDLNINNNLTVGYDVKSRKVTQFTSNSSYNGGAIYAEKGLNIVSTTFTSNSAKGSGGAIYLANSSTGNNILLNTDFTKNSAVKGGAIYVGEGSTLTVQDSSFTNNTATEAGGAIYACGGSIVDIFAINSDVIFKGNKANGKSNAIHLKDATLNLQASTGRKISIFDDISGTGVITKYGDVYIANEAKLEAGSDITIDNGSGSLIFANENNVSGMSIKASGKGDICTANGNVRTLSLNTLSLSDDTTTNVAIDMDLKKGESDKITAEKVEGSGILSVNKVNLTNNSKTPVSINVGEGSEISDISTTTAESAEATYKLKQYLDSNGRLMAVAYGQKAKPCALAAPVAAQIGGYLTQINSYDQAFMNMDMNMLKTREERQSERLNNRYASSDSSYTAYSEDNGINLNSKGLWTRPYATFERVNLNNGPKVSNIGYGNFFGGDAEVKELNNGWKRQFSAYVGYNGSIQDYDRQSIDQNGGTLGVTEVWYKNNFFTGLTANVGANSVNANTDLGNENFPMLMAGIASKSGYNFEFKDGKFVIQPSLLLSYSFVHTFSHDNGRGNKVGSSPLHAIQVAPGVKFIFNLPKGWQPYLGVNMRWNIIDKTHFSLQDVSIPDMSIDPYVEYGVGLQRRWGERFTGYGQAMIRNGGRNGVMLSFGFKWAIGK